ncbi:hypothetical protein AX15_000610 [Amanita polypyramis BW_CC]|nr:hypothetical protein AX15_000610 [Amanita polypyramis BW_CC]
MERILEPDADADAMLLRQRSLRRADNIQQVVLARSRSPRRDRDKDPVVLLGDFAHSRPGASPLSPMSPQSPSMSGSGSGSESSSPSLPSASESWSTTSSPPPHNLFQSVNMTTDTNANMSESRRKLGLGPSMTGIIRRIQALGNWSQSQPQSQIPVKSKIKTKTKTGYVEPSAPHDASHSPSEGRFHKRKSRPDSLSDPRTHHHHSNNASAALSFARMAGLDPGYNVLLNHDTLSSPADVHVPPLLREGTQMTKVTSKKRKKVIIKLNPDIGQIVWEVVQPLGRQRIIPIENIKEMRSGADARYYREQFQLSQVYEDCWLTIIYILDGTYKTLHLIAPSVEVFRMWDATLRKLYVIRRELMSGLGNFEIRQALWEKQYWKGSDLEGNERLRFGEVEKLCKRMNIHSSSENLFRLFKQADVKNNGYLDFDDFRQFVKLLKGRPEVDRLYKKIVRSSPGGHNVFDFKTFEYFMREKQKSTLSQAKLKEIFDKYATFVELDVGPHSPIPTPILTLDSFTSFLMSTDNCAFTDQHGKVWHDMTRPLSDYFVASSHNTYLVGHQLVGVSTIEGYIRALLHSCRSVEVDIYDGDVEPMIFHGKTLTSKVSLREVCQAISKYGFVASIYPIVISAEMHCSLPMQEMVVDIMVEVFGDTLVRMEVGEHQEVDVLPSPEELKGKILFKTKDVTALRQNPSDVDLTFTETSGTSSASDSDFLQDLSMMDVDMKRRLSNGARTIVVPAAVVTSSPKSPLSPPIQAAKTVIQKVRHVSKSSGGGATARNGSGNAESPNGSFFRVASGPARREMPDILSSSLPLSKSTPTSPVKSGSKSKQLKISPKLQSLMVYTVGVKFQGINKKVEYASEHMFSLSETTANKMIKTGGGTGMYDLIKHCRTHLVRIYPKGLRVSSTNYEPHRYWSAGAQLVAMNWQTFDLGSMINHAMFQRNGRSGYVLKPAALRPGLGMVGKALLGKRTRHYLDVTVISAQQLPRPKDSNGREMVDRPVLDPYVEVTVHVPDWTYSQEGPGEPGTCASPSDATSGTTACDYEGEGTTSPADEGEMETPSGSSNRSRSTSSPSSSTTTLGALSARSVTHRTTAVKNNGFNPVWEETIRIPFECVGDMWDLVFVRFAVRQEDRDDEDPLAVYCVSLGSLGHGYRHLPLHDAQLSQYLFSTLFVKVDVEDAI